MQSQTPPQSPTSENGPADDDITSSDPVGGRPAERKSLDAADATPETKDDRHLREARWLSEDRGWSQNTQGMSPEGGARDDDGDQDQRETSRLSQDDSPEHERPDHVEAENPIVGNVSDGGVGTDR